MRKDCQDPFNSQYPYGGAINLLAAVCDSELESNDAMDDRLQEDNVVTGASQGLANDMSHRPHDTCSGSYCNPGVDRWPNCPFHQRQAGRQLRELAQQERRNIRQGGVDLGSRCESPEYSTCIQ
jgi:hypothetical protein